MTNNTSSNTEMFVVEGLADSIRSSAAKLSGRAFVRNASRHMGQAVGSVSSYVVHGTETAGEGTAHYVIHKSIHGEHEHKKNKKHKVVHEATGSQIRTAVVAGALTGGVAAHYLRKHYDKKKHVRRKHVRESIGELIAGAADDIGVVAYKHLTRKDKPNNNIVAANTVKPKMMVKKVIKKLPEGFASSAARIGKKAIGNKWVRGGGAFLAAAGISSAVSDVAQSATEKYLKNKDKVAARKSPKSSEEVPQASQGMQYEGVIGAAAGIASKAGKFIAQRKNQIKSTGKFVAGQSIGGAAIGATIPIVDRYLAKKEKETAAKQAGQPVSEALHKEPPVVLILKRKSIRLFPQGDKVALYKNDKTGISFAVPYDDPEDAVKSNNEIIGAVSEGVFRDVGSAAWREFRRTMAARKKSGPFTYDAKEAEEAAKRHAEAEKAYEKLHKSIPGLDKLPKGSGRAAAWGVSAAVGTGYVVDKGTRHIEKIIDNPDRSRRVNGRPVYTNEAAKSPGAHLGRPSVSGALKNGAAIGGGLILAKAAYDTGKKYLETKSSREKQDNFEKLQRQNMKYVKKIRMRKEEVEQLDEFLPALMAAARAAPAVIRAAAASPLGRYAGKAIGVGSTVGGLVGLGSATIKKKKKQTSVDPDDRSDSSPDAEPNPSVSEATSHHQMTPIKAKVNKFISKDVRKHIAIAAAGALGAKLVDIGYDAYRDHADIKKAEKEEKAKARAQKEVAPKKIIIQKKTNPKTGTTTVKKEIKEAKEEVRGYGAIVESTRSGSDGYVHHNDGTRSKVDVYTAHMIQNIHESLSIENQQKLREMVARDRSNFNKIVDFAHKQHNK